jgi:Ca2+-binding EF-hand superfamily protein
VINRLFENDRDGDGKLSRDEVPQGKEGIFDLADTNQDGYVDRSELESALRKKRQ